jgi:hypothetical protein
MTKYKENMLKSIEPFIEWYENGKLMGYVHHECRDKIKSR